MSPSSPPSPPPPPTPPGDPDRLRRAPQPPPPPQHRHRPLPPRPPPTLDDAPQQQSDLASQPQPLPQEGSESTPAAATTTTTTMLLPLPTTVLTASPPPVQAGVDAGTASDAEQGLQQLSRVLTSLGYNEMASAAPLLADAPPLARQTFARASRHSPRLCPSHVPLPSSPSASLLRSSVPPPSLYGIDGRDEKTWRTD